MRYLLDTGVWIWSVSASGRLNRKSRQLIENEEHELYFSAASVWEICIKTQIGKLSLPESPVVFVPERLSIQRIQNLSITTTHATGIYSLPRHHDDPFDRILIAQARAENMVILTSDTIFKTYDVEIFWCGR